MSNLDESGSVTDGGEEQIGNILPTRSGLLQ
jgi:hypothetical protein